MMEAWHVAVAGVALVALILAIAVFVAYRSERPRYDSVMCPVHGKVGQVLVGERVSLFANGYPGLDDVCPRCMVEMLADAGVQRTERVPMEDV